GGSAQHSMDLALASPRFSEEDHLFPPHPVRLRFVRSIAMLDYSSGLPSSQFLNQNDMQSIGMIYPHACATFLILLLSYNPCHCKRRAGELSARQALPG